ncbi:hypothetical protein [Variovorax saccharolyticus]|uniref:hypothetical protein n=1 Tax=Variovorax saccharolyticus TaxID=3053516 RepID=UPI00257758B5|nr:hypothetical protein [Variovorax sp. J22R187]MDM0022176.1 hypothetical protein [Variovorax sp. J22R187]
MDARSILTVLVDLGKHAETVPFVDRLLRAVDGVQAHGWQRHCMWPGAMLMAQLLEHPPSTLNLVLRLPARNELDVRIVDDLVDGLRSLTPHAVGLVAAVAVTPADWSDLNHVSSFLQADADRSAAAAAGLFEVFACLMADVALVEVDGADLACFLGPASAPSFLIDAAWGPGTGLRVVGCSTVQPVARGAVASLATTIASEPMVGSMRALHRALIERRVYGDVAMSVTSGLFKAAPSRQQDEWPVRILCRPV